MSYFDLVTFISCLNKKRVSYLYRTATTFYPCCLPALGEFKGSWSYKTYPAQKYKLKIHIQKFYTIFLLNFFNSEINYICLNN